MAKKRKRKFRLSSIFYVFLILFLSAGFIVGGYGLYYISDILKDVPALDVSRFDSEESTRIYDANDELIVDLGTQSRENVEYEELPQVVIDAFISVEDSRFFEHNGFDLPRFIKAALENLKTRQFSQGGSTITMQVVKNSYFTTAESQAEKSIPRKVKEIYLSIQTEQVLSKQDIFEYYINKILFGGNNYGIQKGAAYYFGKDVSELTLPEAAYLAGVINAPGSYNAYTNLSLAQSRMLDVLYLMYYHGYITYDEYQIALQTKLENLLVYEEATGNAEDYPYQAYLDAVVDEVISLTGDNPYDTPMIIHTYMDRGAQTHAESVLAGETSVTYPTDNELFQSAFTVIENTTGHIVALGGGRNYTGQRQFNRATSMYKQMGSTAKPLLAYSLAFEELGWATTHVVEDIPIVYRGTNILLPDADGQYLGEITLEEAISRSRNTSAMLTFEALVDKLGIDRIVSHIQAMGFDINPNEFTLGYVVGSSTFQATPTQLAAAYSIFARGGNYIKPTTIKSIEYMDASSENIEPNYLPTQVISEQAAYLMSVMLNKCTQSPWYNYMGILDNKNYKVYAKTGTTDYGDEAKQYNIPTGAIKDKWTAAYTSDYTVAVWTGYDEAVKDAGTYFNSAKNQLNIPVKTAKEMIDYMSTHSASYPEDIQEPDGIAKITHVLGTYPYAYSDSVDPSYIVTGLIKEEYNEVVGMAPTPVETLQTFEAKYAPEYSALYVNFAEYPDPERVKEATGTKMYYLTYYPDAGQSVPTSYMVDALMITDENGNQVEQYPAVGSNGRPRVTLGVEANLIYDEKTYYGNVNYFVDVYENGELLTTYASGDKETAFVLPLLSSNEIKACGYYALTGATDVRSNEICVDVIVPFSSQISSDPEFADIADFLKQLFDHTSEIITGTDSDTNTDDESDDDKPVLDHLED